MAGLVLIADDDKYLLDFLADIIKNAGFRVKAATNGQQAVELFWEEPADIVLLDFKMPDTSGVQAMAQIKEMRPSVPVFMMSGEGDIPVAVSAMKQGARDFLVKPMDFNALISTLKDAAPAVSEDPEDSDTEPEALTERQKEILALTSSGHSSTAIADLLNISYRTVETHRVRAMKKLKLRSRSEMVSFALNNDILRKIK